MNLFKKQQATIGYNSIPDALADDETAAVPLGTTILLPAMATMDRRLSKRMMLAIVAGVMLIGMAGGTVLMLAKTPDCVHECERFGQLLRICQLLTC